jgi:hypothetical protein
LPFLVFVTPDGNVLLPFPFVISLHLDAVSWMCRWCCASSYGPTALLCFELWQSSDVWLKFSVCLLLMMWWLRKHLLFTYIGINTISWRTWDSTVYIHWNY